MAASVLSAEGAQVSREPTQIALPFTARELLPANVTLVETADLDLNTSEGWETVVMRMLQVPLDKSILLDFLLGRRPGDPHPSEEHAEAHRLMMLLNSRQRGKRFDFLGQSMAARMFRESVRTRAWDPFAGKSTDPSLEVLQ